MNLFFVSFAFTAMMLAAMGIFLLFTPPLHVVLKYDVPNDSRFVRGLVDVYLVAVTITGVLAALCFVHAGLWAMSAVTGCIAAVAFAARRYIVRRMDRLRETMHPQDAAGIHKFRRLFMGGMALNGMQMAVLATGMAKLSSPEAKAIDVSSRPVPRRVLTGRSPSGKSVFQSFDVTPQVVHIDSNPGLTFYELYATEGVPGLTGKEPDPMLRKTQDFPGPGGTNFRLISYPPRRPPGWKPPPGVTFESALAELDEKVPGMGRHFDRDAPGMHTTDTIDYGIVVRGEMTLELDDGEIVHLRQGDCVIQNGTRHRWRNPLAEPCLMAFVSIGARRAG